MLQLSMLYYFKGKLTQIIGKAKYVYSVISAMMKYQK
jgi:hypothetical protein